MGGPKAQPPTASSVGEHLNITEGAQHVTTEELGRYLIKGEGGRGGIGQILVAHDNHLARDVAIKELLSEFVEGGSTPSRVRTAPDRAARN